MGTRADQNKGQSAGPDSPPCCLDPRDVARIPSVSFQLRAAFTVVRPPYEVLVRPMIRRWDLRQILQGVLDHLYVRGAIKLSRFRRRLLLWLMLQEFFYYLVATGKICKLPPNNFTLRICFHQYPRPPRFCGRSLLNTFFRLRYSVWSTYLNLSSLPDRLV